MKDFDPFHAWLGIPPREQPPHYYRLLGVDVFEPEAEVIENAVERLRSHVTWTMNNLDEHRWLIVRTLPELEIK